MASTLGNQITFLSLTISMAFFVRDHGCHIGIKLVSASESATLYGLSSAAVKTFDSYFFDWLNLALQDSVPNPLS